MRFLRGLFPGGILTLAAVGALVLQWSGTLEPDALDRWAATYGLVVYGAGLALAFIFHRSRAFALLLVLAWTDVARSAGWIVEMPPGEAAGGAGAATSLDPTGAATSLDPTVATGVLLLVLLALLSFVRDRGVASRFGLLQIGAASALALVGGWLLVDLTTVPALELRNALREVVRLPLLGAEHVQGYPLAVVGAAILSAAAIGFALYRYRGPVERAFVGAWLLILLALHPTVLGAGASLLFVAVGLTLTLGIVETSYVMAYRDELTGLPGRRALMQYLDGLQGTYTIAMVDVDHFKRFNDKHGHDVGDQVLKLVAAQLGQAPGGGKAYRYGGEEFTLLYPGRTREDALPHLDEVRESVEDARFALRSWKRPRKKPEAKKAGKKKKAKRKPRTLSVTVSIGMADSTGKESAPDAVLNKADKALYRAKNKGRNQVSK